MSHDATSSRPILKGFTYLIGHLLCNLAYFDEAWWLNCRFGTLRPEGSRFEFHSSHHVVSPSLTFACSASACLLQYSINVVVGSASV